MNEEVETRENKGFPWVAMVVFLVVALAVGIYTSVALGTELESEGDMTLFFVLGGAIGGLIGAAIRAGIQYVFTKFPTQWISKEENVYKYDIWSAIFYSSAISTVLGLLLQQFNYQENIIASVLTSIVTTGLFLFFYFSGEEKKQNVKKAITIVQIAWLIIGIVLSFASLALLSTVGV